MRLAHYRRLWSQLHDRAVHTPGWPDPILERRWLASFYSRIGCAKCQRHWRRLYQTHPPELTDRRSYFRWTVRMHNAINQALGKPVISFAVARARWCFLT